MTPFRQRPFIANNAFAVKRFNLKIPDDHVARGGVTSRQRYQMRRNRFHCVLDFCTIGMSIIDISDAAFFVILYTVHRIATKAKFA